MLNRHASVVTHALPGVAMNTQTSYRSSSLRKYRRPRVLGWAVASIVLFWAWRGAEIQPGALIDNAGDMARLAGDFFPPRIGNLDVYVAQMLVTVQMALLSTLLAAILAIPCACLSLREMTPWWVHRPVRGLMRACHTVHELVFAMLFVFALGQGPFAGTLALLVPTTGLLAKRFSNAMEASETGMLKSSRITPRTGFGTLGLGALPYLAPAWASMSLTRFETNLRSATVLGMVGGGGIGVSLWETLRGFQYPETATILLVIVGSIMLLDRVSCGLRKHWR
ncbi:phosphonate transport system permease protein [Modicisalibacter ilicicola DSM 19980]|uniref:Phosphonate transport system permease protein n=1 Tax=Modicisalibacter ilicicola DSM 19980 TaxID=1121942 RepID=A0A1M5F7J1_9GAMM|nr:phosphonate ABC transporter, permease protein PhnE [Halomonas ilicicola]SHF87570.1 phosphonate transport system permease protein [Halomonas ilicicola DSM 19980]